MDPVMDNRRNKPRAKSLLGAKIMFGGKAVIDCLARDLTDDGARLVLAHTIGIPDQFDLYIERKKQTFAVEVAWRKPDQLGVAFRMAAVAAPLSDAEKKARELKAQNAALRRRIEELNGYA